VVRAICGKRGAVSLAGTRVALVTPDGDKLGAVELGRPDSPDGSIIYRGDKPNLRVVGWLKADDDDPELFEVLIVEEA
jgi:hypothetical protein